MSENTLAEKVLNIRQHMYLNNIAGKLSMWTVYDSPLDYSGKFVARLFEVDDEIHPTPSIIITPDLATLRYIMAIEFGLVSMSRDPADDSKIVEVWI